MDNQQSLDHDELESYHKFELFFRVNTDLNLILTIYIMQLFSL